MCAADRYVASGAGWNSSTLVELSPHLRFAAVDLGATSIDVEVVNARLEPVAAYAEPADIRLGPKVILQRVNGLLHKAKADGAYEKLDAIGVGVPGPVSFRDGILVSPPIMPGWDRFPVRELLTREHGCPAVVDNDVSIMTIGERHGGVAHSVDDFLFVKIGTGIGYGIYLAGEVYRGTDGCDGDIGHIQGDAHGPMCSCGNIGCLEACSAARRWPGRRRWPPAPAPHRRWPSGSRPPARSPPATWPRATSPASVSSVTAGAASAASWPGWSASSTRR